MFLNWTQIISNSITGAIQGSITAVAVFFAMRLASHAVENKSNKKDGEK